MGDTRDMRDPENEIVTDYVDVVSVSKLKLSFLTI